MPSRRIAALPPFAGAVHAVDPERVHAARGRLLDDTAYAQIAETFRALADSTRAKVVHTLSDYPLCVSDLAQVVGISEPAVSQHLRVLRALRIVHGRRSGKMVYYQLEDVHVRALLGMALGHWAEIMPASAAEVLS